MNQSLSSTILFSNGPLAHIVDTNNHGFDLKGVFEADEDMDSLTEHPAVGGQGQVGHHSVQHSAPGGSRQD